MNFKNVKISNFMSLGEVDLDLSKVGLHLVLGSNRDSESFDSNGSGKSSIFDAIVWALYGEILRKVSIDNLVRNGEDNCKVSVDIDTGTEIVNITRERSLSNSKSYLEVRDSAGKLLFPSDSITAMQESINTFLGLDFKTFTNSVYFGKGLSQFFMLADDKTRKDILEAILQLVDFDEAHFRVKEKYKDTENLINQSNKDLESNSKTIDLKKKSYDLYYRSYEEQNAVNTPKIEALIAEKEEINKKISTYTFTFSTIKGKIEKYEFKYTTLKKKIEDTINFENGMIIDASKIKKQKAEAAYFREVSNLTSVYNTLTETLQKHESVLVEKDISFTQVKDQINEEASDYRAKIEDCNNYLKAVAEIKDGATCGVCQSVVTPEHKHFVVEKFKQDRKDFNVIFDNINARRLAIITKLKENTEELNNIRSMKQEAMLKYNNDKFTKLSKKLVLEKEIDDQEALECNEVRQRYANRLNQEFKTYNDAVNVLKEDLAKLTAEHSQLSNQYSTANTIIITLEGQLKQTHDLIVNLDKELEELEIERKELKKTVKTATKELEMLSFWVDAFSQKGIRSFIFETSLPELSARANYYSVALSGGSISINILPTTIIKSTGNSKEKLNIIVTNKLGAMSYDGCSEGEKRRIDLCLLLSLQDLVSSRGTKRWDTIFYDELLDTLDNTGIDAVINLLKTEFPSKSIYIISHNSDVKNFFDSAITVIKQNGVSTICT